jgi:hypothetical protein
MPDKMTGPKHVSLASQKTLGVHRGPDATLTGRVVTGSAKMQQTLLRAGLAEADKRVPESVDKESTASDHPSNPPALPGNIWTEKKKKIEALSPEEIEKEIERLKAETNERAVELREKSTTILGIRNQQMGVVQDLPAKLRELEREDPANKIGKTKARVGHGPSQRTEAWVNESKAWVNESKGKLKEIRDKTASIERQVVADQAKEKADIEAKLQEYEKEYPDEIKLYRIELSNRAQGKKP